MVPDDIFNLHKERAVLIFTILRVVQVLEQLVSRLKWLRACFLSSKSSLSFQAWSNRMW